MRIHALCSDPAHPVVAPLDRWLARRATGHDVARMGRAAELTGGDALFLVSCAEVIRPETRALYRHVVTLHAGDVPRDRGWSPHVWTVAEGGDAIVVAALSAADPVDSGDVWAKRRVPIPRHALWDEINAALFDAEFALMDEVLAMIEAGAGPTPQAAEGATWRRRRTPADSALDPDRSIAEQFDLMRVCDPVRYPAHFRLRGHVYKVRLEKVSGDDGADGGD